MKNQITQEELQAIKENRLKARTYEHDDLVVYWQPRLCIHSANCFLGLPGVFNPQKRPWIMPEKGTAEEIIETINTCPTRALLYRRKKPGIQESIDNNLPISNTEYEETPADVQMAKNKQDKPAFVKILKDGPALISGNFSIRDHENKPINYKGDVVSICRCGASKRKPLCDGSHLKTGYQDER